MMMVFFMEITSFLLGFSVLSMPYLTSEEKIVDRMFFEIEFYDELNRRVTSVEISSEEEQS
jgi:hypothetical protein